MICYYIIFGLKHKVRHAKQPTIVLSIASATERSRNMGFVAKLSETIVVINFD